MPPFSGHKGIDHFRQVGEENQCWYFANCVTRGSLTQNRAGINRIYAIPFPALDGGTLIKLGVRVLVGAPGSKIRIGIYRALSATNLYPGALLFGSAEFDGSSVETKTANISVNLVADLLYYFCYIAGVMAPTVRAIPIANAYPIFGSDRTLGTLQRTHYRVQHQYGPLPDPFPLGGALGNGDHIGIAGLFGS